MTKTILTSILLLVLGVGATVLFAETPPQPRQSQPIVYQHRATPHLPPLHLPRAVMDFEAW